jgi:metal-responsive CopG/Arc/MetJ family transcriptional regulator
MEKTIMLRVKVSKKLYQDVAEKTKSMGYTSKSEFIRDCMRRMISET